MRGRFHLFHRGSNATRSAERSGDGLIRTLDEDDGIMVLRFGSSAEIDLSASISCEARSGDDW